jgi:hypothetical protein
MKRLIDADKLHDKIEELLRGYAGFPDEFHQGLRGGLVHAIHLIEIARNTDAVDMVRCRDCARRGTNRCAMYEDSDEATVDWTEENGFCSLGEERQA